MANQLADYTSPEVQRPLLERLDDSQRATHVSLAQIDTLLDRLANVIELQPTSGCVGDDAPKPTVTLEVIATNLRETSLYADNMVHRLQLILSRLS